MSKGSTPSRNTETVTTTQKSDPWSGQQPYLTDLYRTAQGIFGGQGPQYYPGQTVSPFSAQQDMAMQLIQGRALAGSPLNDAAQNQGQFTMGGGYLGASPGQGYLDYSMYGENPMGGPSSGFTSGVMGQNPRVNPSYDYLSNTASGGMLNANPWLDKTFDQAASRVTDAFKNVTVPGINSQAAGGGGMFGSEAWRQLHDTAQTNLGDTLNNLATNVYGGNYANERGLQQGAAGQIQGAYDASLNRGLGAANLAQGAYDTSMGRGLSAAGMSNDAFANERNNMLQTMGLSPVLSNMDYADFDRLMGVGNQVQGQSQNLMNDQQNRWDFYNTGLGSPETRLQNYAGIVQGMNPGGSTTGTQTSPLYGQDPLMGALGGGMAGAGLASSLGLASPWGWGLAGLGALGGMK